MTKATNTQAEFWIGAVGGITDRDAPLATELNAFTKVCPIDGTLQVGGVNIETEDVSTICDLFDVIAITKTATDDITFDVFTEAEPDPIADTLLVAGSSFVIAYTRRPIATPGTWAAGDTVTTLQIVVGSKVPQAMSRTANDRYAITLPAQDGAGYNNQTVA